MLQLKNFIGGEFTAPESNQYLDTFEPATGRVLGKVPDSDGSDIEQAVQAALSAFEEWSQKSPAERSEVLYGIADAIEAESEELARCESQDQGKPVHLATQMDIPRAAQNFRFFAGAILHDSDEAFKTSGNIQNYTLRSPIGVCGLISPWNLPLYLLSWKIAPALAMGNTVVCKPSEWTSSTAFKLAEIFARSSAPKGICNMVFGLGSKAGAALVQHPSVPLISFTGGTETAAKIAQDAAPFAKKLSLELGGKNPAIVCADADLTEAVATTVRSSFLNQGEICLCTSRILIEESCYEEFKRLFVEKVTNLQVGLPDNPDSFNGAIVSKQHLEKIRSFVKLAKGEGAKMLCGGSSPTIKGGEDGYYFSPTVLEGVRSDSRVFQDEIFGPVVSLHSFQNDQEALQLANQTRYGLAATIWTSDLNKAHQMAAKVDAGQIWINSWLVRDLRVPFGGMKHSGVGREGGRHSLEFYSEQKNICLKLQPI